MFDTSGFPMPSPVLFLEPQFNLEIASYFEIFFLGEEGERGKKNTKRKKNDGWLIYPYGSR